VKEELLEIERLLLHVSDSSIRFAVLPRMFQLMQKMIEEHANLKRLVETIQFPLLRVGRQYENL